MLRNKLSLWLERRLYFPGCDKKILYFEISSWIGGFISVVEYLAGLVLLLILAPEATIFISYAIYSASQYAIVISLFLIFRRHIYIIGFLHLMTTILVTFFFILKLGGIPTSGGLIFIGFNMVINTLPRQKFWFTMALFCFNTVLVVLMVVLKPWLQVPDQVTPALNSVLYMMHTLFGFIPVFIMTAGFIKRQRKFEEMETRHLTEISELKERLFTNITHEFRTPLTIIQGMADLISKQPDQWSQPGLQKIKTNSSILLRMVTQMLDLSRIEKNAMPVTYSFRNVNKDLSVLIELFRSEAVRRKIDLKFIPDPETFEMDVDTDKLMHIITNLLSNALKFTPEGGKIEVFANARNNGNGFSIRVKDSGIGIGKEHLDHIFDRFYRVEHGTSVGGTGLGLALSKEMVEMLNGTISVDSIPGKGTEFEILLPVTRKAARPDLQGAGEIMAGDPMHQSFIASLTGLSGHDNSGDKQFFEEIDETSAAPILLIVEDNSDVVQYLHAILKNEYKIVVAENGLSGSEKAMELVPDIILSDVMMPVMDGIALLEKVKTDVRTSHIPVVMLTAKADIDSRLAGLERGADVYLAKPFNEKELRIQLKNLVDLRKKLYERYSVPGILPETSDKYFIKEDTFMTKVRQVLENNLQDEEFGISQLCNEMAVSRAQFYRKFKFLSNRTIADYFKSMRLQKARELLLTTDLNITEITYNVGFKSPSHFSREFQFEFGESPSEFRK